MIYIYIIIYYTAYIIKLDYNFHFLSKAWTKEKKKFHTYLKTLKYVSKTVKYMLFQLNNVFTISTYFKVRASLTFKVSIYQLIWLIPNYNTKIFEKFLKKLKLLSKAK